MRFKKSHAVLFSPCLILLVNVSLAWVFRPVLEKWSFVPMIIIGWILWIVFIWKFGGPTPIRKWLRRPNGSFAWGLLALIFGLIPMPLFLFHYDTLSTWQIWLPWITVALINPWIEEFYWRGLLLDYTRNWPSWAGILYSSFLFSLNHMAFGVNSELNSGFEILVSTFLMGMVWGWVYRKTGSLRWTILAHFLVDFLGLSVPAFLDLWTKGTW